MKTITVTIPDTELESLMDYLHQFPSTDMLVENVDFELDDAKMNILDLGSALDLKFCISREQLNHKLKNAI